MIEINKRNWKMLVKDYLQLLSRVYEDDIMPSMIDESDKDERVEEIKEIIKYLKRV